MPFGAVVGGLVSAGGSILSGVLGGKAADKAAQAQQQAAQASLDFTKSVYNQGVTNLTPYIGAGQSALKSLLGFYGLPGGNPGGAAAAFNQFTQLPSYQFPLQQGLLQTNRQLAASGLIGSGAALRDATKFAQDYASTGLGTYLSGLGGISGAGSQAAGTLLGQGNTAANTVASAYGYQGNAAANGIVGANNALTSGLQNALPYLVGSPTGGVGGTSYGGGQGSYQSGGQGWGGGVLGAFTGGNNYVDSGTWNQP